ncbi:hypothetical protein M5C72_03190 [Companilactobacillus allii]|uniref:Uncharacterized protein n=1 Tax=Companilactobacillus allii TaxID=1847728 RepID=A0A1P8Q2S3_9LACO|nr:hypothetical protein [Companilactobacillus allii]APX72158.1 hypothetical protein BTM29_06115 [Companilactobacillus allii]USQ69256.1 hypothetical protein M5C72_03190 [Companilactobacillus allii]
MQEFLKFFDWYTNYFIEIKTSPENLIDPKNLKGIDKLGTISSNGLHDAWHLKSKMEEDDLKRHLFYILTSETNIDPKTEMTLTKGIDGGPLKML